MTIVTQTQRLSSSAALTAVSAAVSHAETLGVRINACVVDAGGNQIAFLRGDDAFLPSGKIARDKARTSAGFKLPSGTLYDVLKEEPAVLAGILSQPGVAAFPGGVPVVVNGEVIGGIGVSGASAEQDDACARAGLRAIGLSSE